MSSTSRCVAPGTRSDGFMILAPPCVMSGSGVAESARGGCSHMELPQTAASGNIQRGIIAGKLKGAMPAVTPRGTR